MHCELPRADRREVGWQRVLLPSQAPVPALVKPQSNHGGKCLLVREVRLALLPHPGLRSGVMSAHPGRHRRARTGLCGPSSSEEEAGVEEEVAGGRPGNCNSLWMGWTGRGGDRSQPSTSINLPSGPTGWSRGCSLSAGVRRDPVQLRRGSTARPAQLRSAQAVAARGWLCTLGCLRGSVPRRPGSHSA